MKIPDIGITNPVPPLVGWPAGKLRVRQRNDEWPLVFVVDREGGYAYCFYPHEVITETGEKAWTPGPCRAAKALGRSDNPVDPESDLGVQMAMARLAADWRIVAPKQAALGVGPEFLAREIGRLAQSEKDEALYRAEARITDRRLKLEQPYQIKGDWWFFQTLITGGGAVGGRHFSRAEVEAKCEKMAGAGALVEVDGIWYWETELPVAGKLESEKEVAE